MIYRPRVAHNVNHWQVFNNDTQLKEFLECTGDFSEVFFKGSKYDGKMIREEPTNSRKII